MFGPSMNRVRRSMQLTLDTVQSAMQSIAPQLTGHLAVTVERGPDTHQGQSGYITVKWPASKNHRPGVRAITGRHGWRLDRVELQRNELRVQRVSDSTTDSQTRTRARSGFLSHRLTE
jgi:hypothetical protein